MLNTNFANTFNLGHLTLSNVASSRKKTFTVLSTLCGNHRRQFHRTIRHGSFPATVFRTHPVINPVRGQLAHARVGGYTTKTAAPVHEHCHTMREFLRKSAINSYEKKLPINQSINRSIVLLNESITAIRPYANIQESHPKIRLANRWSRCSQSTQTLANTGTPLFDPETSSQQIPPAGSVDMRVVFPAVPGHPVASWMTREAEPQLSDRPWVSRWPVGSWVSSGG